MENVIVKLDQSNAIQNFMTLAKSVNWDMTHEECYAWFKIAMAGITDCCNMFKNKDVPVVVLVQDLKGNRIIFACVQYIKADDESETATGSWTYFWSWNMDDIPEGSTIYTLDQSSVQKVIAQRGHDMYFAVMANLPYVAQLTVYMFNIIKDVLDQQAVEEGKTWTLELDGFFEASVEVKNGQKEFSFLPKGEMKVLIKDDAASEK